MPELHNVDLGADHYRARIATIQSAMAARDLDGLLILDAANVSWACGFFHAANERPLGLYVPASGGPTLFVPLLEREHAALSWVGDVRIYEEFPGPEPAELWMLREAGGRRVALDGGGYSLVRRLQASLPGLEVDPLLAPLRQLKSPGELRLTELAALYADAALEAARGAIAALLREGLSEARLVQIVRETVMARQQRELAGAAAPYSAVTLTAHTGPLAALPHGRPGPELLKPGDTVIVGVGASVGGYHAESGCTFVVGQPDAEQRRCLEATWACDEAAVAALRPGASCESVNAAAMAVLREAGYGADIRHRIGHGMGVQGHEAPWLSVGDQTALAPSMVFSNEPGIYRPGRDGYRIIDSMVVTEQGGRRLSRYLSAHGPDDRVIAA